jgi:MSHA biogenesis protein MshM
MLCFGGGRQQVTRRHDTLAAQDTNGVVGARPGVRWPWQAAGVSVLVAACGLTWALTK